jgi:5-methylcytosine-specific restriction protein A
MPNRRITGHEKRVVAARQRWECAVCHQILSATFEVDHVVPLHKGGADEIGNCQALCTECHRQKTVREEIERLRALESAATTRSPAVVCTRCRHVLSPYFVHRCPKHF